MYISVQFLFNYFEILQGIFGILILRVVLDLTVNLLDASKF